MTLLKQYNVNMFACWYRHLAQSAALHEYSLIQLLVYSLFIYFRGYLIFSQVKNLYNFVMITICVLFLQSENELYFMVHLAFNKVLLVSVGLSYS